MMGKSVREDKKLIRGKLKSLRAGLPKKEALEKSGGVQKLLFGLPEFQRAKTVSFYVAKEDEVQTERMIKDSLKLGKRVLVPICKESGELALSELLDCDTELEPGSFGVLEPKLTCRRMVPATKAELIVVPGVAFDLSGHRLGRGKGYYDRFLQKVSSSNPGTRFIGLAYEFQVLNDLPHTPGDVPVHKVVTEKRVINAV